VSVEDGNGELDAVIVTRPLPTRLPDVAGVNHLVAQ